MATDARRMVVAEMIAAAIGVTLVSATGAVIKLRGPYDAVPQAGSLRTGRKLPTE